MILITYLTIAYKRNYVLQKVKLKKDRWKSKDREKRGFDRSDIELLNKSTVLT